jgi:CHAT domain-containing protein/tetratricopeptide (TPR) repeat protein
MRKIYPLLFLFLLFYNLSAQDKKQNETILSQIDNALFDSNYEEAIKLVDQTKTSDPSFEVQLKNKKAEALIRLGKFDDADKLLSETETKAAQIKSTGTLSAITQTNIGFLYLNQGRNDLAVEKLTAALNLLQNSGDALATAQALSFLGQAYLNTGKYSQAEEQLLMALSLRQEKLPEVHELIAASYTDLGLVYSRIDIDKSFDNYEKATEIYGKLHGNEHPKFAIANTNLGVVNFNTELYGDAVNYFETALKIWEKNYSQPHASKAYVLRWLGLTYSKLNDDKAALEFYRRALDMYIASQGKKHPNVAYTYNLIGNILQSENKYDEALSNYQKSIISNIADFNNEDVLVNPKINNFYDGNFLLYSLMYKAQVLEARHLNQTLKLSDLTFGLNTLQLCDSLIDKLRQQTTNESDKISLGSIANEVYADGVRISYLLSDVSFRDRKLYREQSFFFAEKSKSAVLQEAIADANAKSFANIPPELLEEENSLKSAMALVTQKLAQKPSEEEEKYLRETAFHLNTSYSEFTKQLETKFPEYFNLKFNSATPSIAQLQDMLTDKAALISYFIDEKNNRIYIYLITNKKFLITDHTLPTDYDRTISGFRNSLYFMQEQAYIKTSRDLYKLLIPKGIPSKVTDLVLLPSGRMSIIPFEAMLTKNIKTPNTPFNKLPYLVKKFGVRYEFSAGLLIQKKNNPTAASITSAKLLAPISFPEGANLNDLPGTKQEVDAIEALFKTKSIRCEVLTNTLASETALKDEDLKNYSLVHLATHGIVDEENPDLSRIFLQNNSQAEDGNLYSGEIYNLHLNANLVTLSACQTGLGKISKGEGVIGLSRALVYAGAKNIIVSFWSVADESTSELMTGFYQSLLQGKNISFADGLKEAKLELITKEKYAAPYYWAPFILIGF